MLILFQMFLKSILEDVGFSVVSVFFLEWAGRLCGLRLDRGRNIRKNTHDDWVVSVCGEVARDRLELSTS